MSEFPYSHTPHVTGPREVEAGPWRVRLHPPRLVVAGTEKDHLTRPNLCKLGSVVAAIYQTTFDTSATPADHRDISVSDDNGQTWRLAARSLDVGSYALMNRPQADAVVLPYDSIRYGRRNQLRGPRVTLRWEQNRLTWQTDTTVASFPETLKGFAIEPIKAGDGSPLYLANDLPPSDKPITAFWGTIQSLPDGRWIVPAYGCYDSDPLAADSVAPEMRRMARFSTHLLISDDEGRTWHHHCQIAGARDLPAQMVEGPSEVALMIHPGLWRAAFRVSALKNHFQPMHYADSTDEGKTWSKPLPLPGVDSIMDPRSLIHADGTTVLSAGRPKIGLYLARGSSLPFHKIDLNEHHNLYLPRLRTTGHTDILWLSDRSLLFIYDYIPDSWRWPGSVFTSPDSIISVRVDLLS